MQLVFATFLLLLLGFADAGQIFAWDVQVIYVTDGTPSSIRLLFALESGLPAGQYIMVNKPTNLGKYSQASVYNYQLPMNTDTGSLFLLQLDSPQQSLNVESAETQFQPMQLTADLVQNSWYVLELIPFSSFFETITGLVQNPFSLYTASTSSPTNKIVYDSNGAFGIMFVEPKPTSVLKATLTVAPSAQVAANQLSSINNPITITITPSKATTGGVIFYIEILEGGFYFMSQCTATFSATDAGVCSLVEKSRSTAQILYEKDIAANMVLTVTLAVNNPYYYSQSDIRVSYYAKLGTDPYGQVLDTLVITPALKTNSIVITQAAKFQVLHGIDFAQDLNAANTNIFSKAFLFVSLPNYYVYNQLRFQFTVDYTFQPTSNMVLQLQMALPCDDIIPYSYYQNFEAVSGKQVKCSFASKKVTCINIATFNKNVNYYIAFRVLFKTALGDTPNFGQVSIQATSIDPVTGLQNSIKQVYTNKDTVYSVLSSQFIKVSNMLDDGVDGYAQKLGDVQIVSVDDVSSDVFTLSNDQVFSTSSSVPLGITTTSGKKSLLFFLKQSVLSSTPPLETDICPGTEPAAGTPTPNNGQLVMNILYNDQIMSFDSAISNSNDLLDFEPNQTTGVSKNGNVISFQCGTINSSPIDSNCDIFQGRDTGPNLFALRHVSFATGFTQYPIRATQKTLDYLITFTSITPGNTFKLIATTIIPGYTITKQPDSWSPFTLRILNYYSSTVSFPRADSPTLVVLSGQIPDSLVPAEYNTVALFFDAGFDLAFIDDDGDYSCSIGNTYCHPYTSKALALSRVSCAGSAHYYHNNAIVFDDVNIHDPKFQLIVPVLATSINPNFVHIAFLDSSSETVAVYALSGATSMVGIDVAGTDFTDAQSGISGAGTPNVYTVSSIPMPVAPTDPPTLAPKLQVNDALYSTVGTIQITAASLFLIPDTTADSGLLIVSTGINLFVNSQITISVANQLLASNDCVTLQWEQPDTAIRNQATRYALYCPFTSVSDNFFANLKIVLLSQAQVLPAGQVYLKGVLSYTLFSEGIAKSFVTMDQVIGESTTCVGSTSIPALKTWSLRDQVIVFPVTFPYALPIDSAQLFGYNSFVIVVSFSIALPSNWLRTDTCIIDNYQTLLSCSPSPVTPITDFYSAIKLTITTSTTTRFMLQNINIGLYFAATSAKQTLSSTLITYAITMRTPNKQDGVNWVYGSNEDTTTQIFAECKTSQQLSINQNTVKLAQFADPQITYQLGSQGTVTDFTMSIQLTQAYDSTGDTIFSNEKLRLQWGFMNQQSFFQLQNCKIYENGLQSFDFASIDSNIIQPNKDLKGMLSRVFLLKCEEIYSPTSIQTQQWSMTWQSYQNAYSLSDPVIVEYSDLELTTAPQPLTATLQTKAYNQPGFDAEYTFSLQTTTSLTVFSRVLIKFPQVFAQRVNRIDGSFTCFINDVNAFCKLISVRKISIHVPAAIDVATDQTTTFEVKITGVSQPNLQVNVYQPTYSDPLIQSIWVQIDVDGVYANGVDFQGSIKEFSQTIPTISTIGAIQLISAQCTGVVRGTSVHTISARFPQGTLYSTNAQAKRSLYIDFWGLNATLSLAKPTCSFIDEAGVKVSETCSMVDCKRLKITNEVVAANKDASVVFTVTLSDILNPLNVFDEKVLPNPNVLFYPYLKYNMFAADDSDLNIIATSSLYRPTALVNFNAVGFDMTKQDFQWKFYYTKFETLADNEIPIGYISREVRLFTSSGEPFQTGFSLSFDQLGTLQSQFTIYPPYLRASLNDPYLMFLLGARPNTPSGIYRFSLQRIGDKQNYVTVPPALQLIVTQRACGLIIPSLDAGVPLGGKSLPIILDFSVCYPSLGDLIITASITQVNDQPLQTIIASISQPQQTITPTQDMSNAQVQFIVQSSQTAVVGNQFKVKFTLQGTCAQYYGTIPDLKTSIIDSTQFNGKPDSSLTVQALQAGKKCYTSQFQVSVQCSQIGLLYYAYYIQAAQYDVTLADIKAKTSSGRYTTILPTIDDPFWTGYGYVKFITANALAQTLTFTKLKSNSTYTVKVFCENLLGTGTVSDVKQVLDLQVCDNEQRLIKATVTFLSVNPLTKLLIKQIACSFTRIFNVAKTRVQSNDFLYCDPIIEAQFVEQDLVANGVVDSDVFNTPTSRRMMHEKRVLQGASQFYSYQYYISPDYTASDSASYNAIKGQLYSSSFFTQLIANTLQPTSFPRDGSLGISETTSVAQPVLGSDVLTIDTYYANFTVSIANQNGYIYLGLDVLQPKRPVHAQLRKGFNGNNMPLISFTRQYLAKNEERTFTFERISDDVKYALYFMVSSDDVSYNAFYDPIIYQREFKLAKIYSILQSTGAVLGALVVLALI